MTTAAFQATYSDWKVVKGRKVVQVVFELPLETADAAYQALGGMPIPANEVWCGIARLNEVRPGFTNAVEATQEHPEGAALAARPPSKSQSQIAGYLCTLGSFQTFLREKLPDRWQEAITFARLNNWPINTPDVIAAETVRSYCNVESRAHLKDNADWSGLLLAYRLWEKEAEVVPA